MENMTFLMGQYMKANSMNKANFKVKIMININR